MNTTEIRIPDDWANSSLSINLSAEQVALLGGLPDPNETGTNRMLTELKTLGRLSLGAGLLDYGVAPDEVTRIVQADSHHSFEGPVTGEIYGTGTIEDILYSHFDPSTGMGHNTARYHAVRMGIALSALATEVGRMYGTRHPQPVSSRSNAVIHRDYSSIWSVHPNRQFTLETTGDDTDPTRLARLTLASRQYDEPGSSGQLGAENLVAIRLTALSDTRRQIIMNTLVHGGVPDDDNGEGGIRLTFVSDQFSGAITHGGFFNGQVVANNRAHANLALAAWAVHQRFARPIPMAD